MFKCKLLNIRFDSLSWLETGVLISAQRDNYILSGRHPLGHSRLSFIIEQQHGHHSAVPRHPFTSK